MRKSFAMGRPSFLQNLVFSSLLLAVLVRLCSMYFESHWLDAMFVVPPTESTTAAVISPTMEYFQKRQDEMWIQQQEKLPEWMVEYAEWHAAVRQAPNDKDHHDRYLIVECVRGQKCGGVADRLRFLPVYMLLAYRTKRILVIQWAFPVALEHFLEPPPALVLDWRTDSHPHLVQWIKENPRPHSLPYKVWEMVKTIFLGGTSICDDTIPGTAHTPNSYDVETPQFNDVPVVCITPPKQEIFNTLLKYYDTNGGCRDPPAYQRTPNQKPLANTHNDDDDHHGSKAATFMSYSKAWRMILVLFFQPTPSVVADLDKQLALLGLEYGEYAAAHLRARYPVMESRYHFQSTSRRSVDADGMKFDLSKDKLLEDARYSVACVAELMASSDTYHLAPNKKDKSMPIYFASDTIEAVRQTVGTMTLDTKAHLLNSEPWKAPPATVQVTGAISENQHEQIQISRSNPLYRPQAFNHIFVDLLLLAGAKCISVGVGGYGLFAGVWSTANECAARHMKVQPDASIQQICERIDAQSYPIFQTIGYEAKHNSCVYTIPGTTPER